MAGPRIKVKFGVDEAALRKWEAFPDELMLYLTDAMREIEKEAQKSAEQLAPVNTGALRMAIRSPTARVPPSFGYGGKSVMGGLDADVPHAWDVHENMAPAGILNPSQYNQRLPGGPEGPRGGWYFTRVFHFEENIKKYAKIIDQFRVKAFDDKLGSLENNPFRTS